MNPGGGGGAGTPGIAPGGGGGGGIPHAILGGGGGGGGGIPHAKLGGGGGGGIPETIFPGGGGGGGMKCDGTSASVFEPKSSPCSRSVLFFDAGKSVEPESNSLSISSRVAISSCASTFWLSFEEFIVFKNSRIYPKSLK